MTRCLRCAECHDPIDTHGPIGCVTCGHTPSMQDTYIGEAPPSPCTCERHFEWLWDEPRRRVAVRVRVRGIVETYIELAEPLPDDMPVRVVVEGIVDHLCGLGYGTIEEHRDALRFARQGYEQCGLRWDETPPEARN